MVSGGTTSVRAPRVRPEFEYENSGLSPQTVRIGFYISTNDFITTADRLIGTRSIKLVRNDTITLTYEVTIPDDLISGQTYWLGVVIDDLGTVAEFHEGNNATYIPIRIK